MQVLYGLHPVLEHLRSGGEGLETILLSHDKKGDAVEEILQRARRKGIPVRRESRQSMDRLVPGKRHQGVLSFCGDFTYTPLERILEADGKNKTSVLLILDSISDPQNLGSLIRSAHCFGARAVVIPKNRAATVTPAVMKVSAGSARHTALCRVANIVRTIEQLKETGYWVYGADASGGDDCRSPDYQGRVALVLGSEGAGLRPLVRRTCDFLVKIPMGGVIDSLNVSVAGGILLYEVARSRLRSAGLSETSKEEEPCPNISGKG
ncbi:MAG: 23S rRNA (guanosine(2251)-2'-O)-methyltransferase RlmB [Syntrophales bacterium]|jgi:23S rRNA (guanosine2251-2'-O)-methyltransferase|nr:23S rRNA (guanosine(2251)-2'-O)-methyltransferase RlmB [Syntrophales bacterium]MCK9527059.1 23S rRNA (guanosine(2251)-2'-O)-methyltransferase RlmB [Syntrophales bacterium]MDX9921816.1 23S rRNA (guanosine(2251)-2'-O)-methyltransferase RlmB [Syntrophales bacterium]